LPEGDAVNGRETGAGPDDRRTLQSLCNFLHLLVRHIAKRLQRCE